MLVSVRLEIVLMLTQDRWTVCAEIPQPRKSFWTHPIELLGDVGHVETHFGPFGDSVISGTVCAKHTVGSEIVLDAPDGTPR